MTPSGYRSGTTPRLPRTEEAQELLRGGLVFEPRKPLVVVLGESADGADGLDYLLDVAAAGRADGDVGLETLSLQLRECTVAVGRD